MAVYRSSMEKIQEIPLETYLVGVVSAEMPIKFELEALKAQALAARTYIVNQLVSGNRLGVPKGADVTDTVLHQVYKDDAELKKAWGTNYSKNLKKDGLISKLDSAELAGTIEILLNDEKLGRQLGAMAAQKNNGENDLKKLLGLIG